jgi:hypothetical protein
MGEGKFNELIEVKSLSREGKFTEEIAERLPMTPLSKRLGLVTQKRTLARLNMPYTNSSGYGAGKFSIANQIAHRQDKLFIF